MARSKSEKPSATVAADEGNRRAELIRAAGRLFREKGYAATTVRDIAAAVGMRSGSPFYHFKSKQELLKAVVLEGMQAALAANEDVVARRLDPRATFQALIRAHLDTVLERGGDFVPVLLHEWRSLSGESRAEIVAAKDRYEAIWQQTLKDLKRAGLIRDDSSLARLLIFGSINWTAQWYRADGTLTVDQLAIKTADFFLQLK